MSLNHIFNRFDEVIYINFISSEIPGELPSITDYRILEINSDLKSAPQTKPPLATNLWANANRNILIISDDFGRAMRCFLSLGWPLPAYYIDLAVEQKNLSNGLLDKDAPLTSYSVDFLFREIFCNANYIYSLKRGEYLKAAAIIEKNGIPFDSKTLSHIQGQRETVREQLITKYDANKFYVDGSFSNTVFSKFLIKQNINWPSDAEGNLILDKDVFEKRADSHPVLNDTFKLRSYLSKLNKFCLPAGKGNRNRCCLMPFKAKTSRNQPSNSDFIFGQPAWLRGLIKPPKGYGIAYIDYCQQEFGIAAALSSDKNMQDAYKSGDPYMAFAIQAGAAPLGATKKTHKSVRDQFKACTLAVQYGMSANSFASTIDQPLIVAQELIRLHKKTFSTFWEWSDATVNYATTHRILQTVYDWRINLNSVPKLNSLRNFSMQANGAEMLRLACCQLLAHDIKVCAPVHDAVLIEGPLCNFDELVSNAKLIMEQASRDILDDFTINCDVEIVRYPDRYIDGRGTDIWDLFYQKNRI